MEPDQQITEPVRKSVLDIQRQNLKAAHKVIYVHRIIYIGYHTFKDNHIKEVMNKIVDDINSGYCDEKLTGLFLHYDTFFCHMVEGSEETVAKHLRLLFKNEEAINNIGKTKLLTAYHHINQRFFPKWIAYSEKPPTLLEKIDDLTDLLNTYRLGYNCMQKIYGLANELLASYIREQEQHVTSTAASDSQEDMRNKRAVINLLPTAKARLTQNLPEYNLLDFLLNSPYTVDLKAYVDNYEHIPDTDAYKDMVWPVACAFVPFNVFQKFHDPIQDLPSRENKEKEPSTEVETTEQN